MVLWFMESYFSDIVMLKCLNDLFFFLETCNFSLLKRLINGLECEILVDDLMFYQLFGLSF